MSGDPTITGDGVIQCVQEELRQMLADCERWRDWPESPRSRDEALAAIYHDALPPPHNGELEYTKTELSRLRPFAIISTDPFGGYSLSMDAAVEFGARGRLRIVIEQDRPRDTYDDPGRADVEARRSLGHLIYSGDADRPGLVELSQAGRMQITGIRAVGPMSQNQEETESIGEVQFMEIDIDWEL